MKPFAWKLLTRTAFVMVHVASLATVATLMALDGQSTASVIAVVLMVAIVQFLYEGWAIQAYVTYRSGRRDEILQLIRATVASKVPLEPAVRLYLGERTTQSATSFVQLFIVILITPIVPAALFFWGWLYWRRFDRRVGEFAQELYDGVPLDDAVVRFPAVLHSEARLAVRVGMVTGKLEVALHRADRRPPTATWLEILPRIAYPMIVLALITGVLLFCFSAIVPKLQKIFVEHAVVLPTSTTHLIDAADGIEEWIEVIVAAILGFITLATWATISSWVCWHLPGVTYFYRCEMRGRVWRMLGLLLEAEIPLPEALQFLAESEELPYAVRKRSRQTRQSVEAGQLLAESLWNSGLLTRSMQPLVTAGQSAGTLPWTLRELGDYYSETALTRARRFSMIFGPLLLIVIGIFVAVAAIGLFTPLVALMEKVSEQ